MKSLDAFYDVLLPELPMCSTAMLDLHLVLLARDLCMRTKCWRDTFDAVDTVAAEPTYDLNTAASQATSVAVHKLTVNSELLFDDAWVPDQIPRIADTQLCTDEPKYPRNEPPFSISDDLSEITLTDAETPDCAVTGGLVIVGSMAPKIGATQLPDLLYVTHLETVREGVLARLQAMSGKPWASADAQAHKAEYERRVQLAATTAQRGYTGALLRTRKWG